jgi:hypothetical protein
MDLLRWFRGSRGESARMAAHMTWAAASVSRTAARAGLFLKKQLWVWPIIAIVMLSVIGFWLRRAIESTMMENLQSDLQTVLNVEAEMLTKWIDTQRLNAQTMANDKSVRESIYELLKPAAEAVSGLPPQNATAATQAMSAGQTKLREELGAMMSTHGYVGFVVCDKDLRIVAASDDLLLGKLQIPEYEEALAPVFDGETVINPPSPSVVPLKDERGMLRTGVPTMFVCAPVRNPSFEIVAVLALRIRPEREFTKLLQIGRQGKSGETYAFDKQGRMVSNSRFEEQLITVGLLPDEPGTTSLLHLQLRAPEGNIMEGYRPQVRRSEMPLTKMAASAIAGNSGCDINGYRDYRGVYVVGAWTWLSKHNLGLATEIDVDEAYLPLRILQQAFWALFALLLLGSIAIFIFTLIVAKVRREAQKSAIAAQQLGQYRLERELGKGAMGVVYKGFHAMLRRPTAIKMLNVDHADDAAIQRFEHEVQITCQLNHPNTVAIYDYGRTPEDVFYYAMEYLDGIDLQTLVEKYGPQPEGRAIAILSQACKSLYEAHCLGLVHRDIKPANIMINYRGGEPDVVKVLDFGLVKTLNQSSSRTGGTEDSLTGTPLYMSPEAFEFPNSVDCRSDLYALGAVGYFLICGQPVFSADSLGKLAQKHIDDNPVPPSIRLGKTVSPELEAALLACLEKSRAKRPQTARELIDLLRKCPAAGSWTTEEAEAWWGRHQRSQSPSASESGSREAILQQTIASGTSIK